MGDGRIGLLGGSFNPAHQGHVHISLQALKILALDHVWWVVSPQNPLKSEKEMNPFGDRLRAARAVATDRRIRVTDVEERLGTRYTVDTLAALTRVFPEKRFVWIMGADNLVQFPQWREWKRLFALVPIAVFDRAPYSAKALAGQAAKVFAASRQANRDSRGLVDQDPPAWNFFHTPLNPATATDIRTGLTPAS